MLEKINWRKISGAVICLLFWFGVPVLFLNEWKKSMMPVDAGMPFVWLYLVEFPVAILLLSWMYPKLVTENKRTWWRMLLMFLGLLIALSGLAVLVTFFAMPLEVTIEE